MSTERKSAERVFEASKKEYRQPILKQYGDVKAISKGQYSYNSQEGFYQDHTAS